MYIYMHMYIYIYIYMLLHDDPSNLVLIYMCY
jgi:hypothetical protein